MGNLGTYLSISSKSFFREGFLPFPSQELNLSFPSGPQVPGTEYPHSPLQISNRLCVALQLGTFPQGNQSELPRFPLSPTVAGKHCTSMQSHKPPLMVLLSLGNNCLLIPVFNFWDNQLEWLMVHCPAGTSILLINTQLLPPLSLSARSHQADKFPCT